MTPKAEAHRAMQLTLGFDVIAAVISMLFAVLVPRLLTEGPSLAILTNASMAAAIFGLAAIFSFYQLRVYRQVWRHSGWPDAVLVLQAVGLASLMFVPVIFVWNRMIGFPRSSLFIAVGAWLVLLFAGRMFALWRSTQEPFQIFQRSKRDAPPAILVANASQAASVLKDLRQTDGGAPVRILGLLEIEGAEPGRAIRGVPVLGGLAEMGKVLSLLNERYSEMPLVAVAGDVRKSEAMTGVLEEASSRGAKVMALGVGKEGLRLQPARPRDLLARKVLQLDPLPVKSAIAGKRVFVTGAGGTIGSELAEQCAKLGASHLTLYDAAEFNLYSIDLTLRESYPNVPLAAHIGDVRDGVRLMRAMQKSQPDVVIHAAALKHVPLMEENACEAILTNVSGAVNAVDAAVAVGASKFVFISTDKAVDPDNVMGATKRLAELAITYRAQGSPMQVTMVRFGNVLGSSGSVVPLFERQIAAGGPITLTHDDVSRYFMTVQEASSLVLQGVAHNKTPADAQLYVLDMGQPIKIRALAEAMIRMKGLIPNSDIEISTTGLRPGETLHEQLTYAEEELLETGIDGLRVVRTDLARVEPVGFEARLSRLIETAADRDRAEALKQLSVLVPDYSPPDNTDESFRRQC